MTVKPLTKAETKFVLMHVSKQADIAKREICLARYGLEFDEEQRNEVGVLVNKALADHFTQ